MMLMMTMMMKLRETKRVITSRSTPRIPVSRFCWYDDEYTDDGDDGDDDDDDADDNDES